MTSYGMTRDSLLIAIGGGSTADLVGVASSFYMRGIDYAVIPTNYISMADGIIGKVVPKYGIYFTVDINIPLTYFVFTVI